MFHTYITFENVTLCCNKNNVTTWCNIFKCYIWNVTVLCNLTNWYSRSSTSMHIEPTTKCSVYIVYIYIFYSRSPLSPNMKLTMPVWGEVLQYHRIPVGGRFTWAKRATAICPWFGWCGIDIQHSRWILWKLFGFYTLELYKCLFFWEKRKYFSYILSLMSECRNTPNCYTSALKQHHNATYVISSWLFMISCGKHHDRWCIVVGQVCIMTGDV